jgi:tetratricopeptide (TPR) repeat protein
MRQNHDFLPRKLTKEEIALAPSDWNKVLKKYRIKRLKAIWLEDKRPGYNTLLAAVMVAIAKKDRHLIDIASQLTKGNMPEHIYLSLLGIALGCFGEKEESLKLMREAVKLNTSHSTLLSLAADTDDLDEKENLARQVLKENPKDSDALRHLAYAKYFKGARQEAERLIDEILSNEPDNIYALEHKGNIYFDKKEYDKALEQYLKIGLKPIPISLQLQICHCYYLLGELRKAKKIARKIQNKVPLAYDYDIEMGIEKANELLVEILNS